MPIKSAITVCRVPEAAAGAFVIRSGLPEAFAQAGAFGFDGAELFLPGPNSGSVAEIQGLSDRHGVVVSAVGTGAGKIKHGLSLTYRSSRRRAEALDFVLRMKAFGAQLGAPAIFGSMQGSLGEGMARGEALDHLAEALRRCGQAAEACGVPFLYEPLNRYEPDLINQLGQEARFLEERGLANVFLLADLFHMNIEESSLPAAIREAGKRIGYMHFADSNRQAMGLGHTDAGPVLEALREMNYRGFLSAEIFPLPTPEAACRQSMAHFSSLTATV